MKRTYATFIRETGAKVSSAPVPACARTSSARGQALSAEQSGTLALRQNACLNFCTLSSHERLTFTLVENFKIMSSRRRGSNQRSIK